MKNRRSNWLLLICVLALLFGVGFHPFAVKATEIAQTEGEDGLTLLSSSRSGVNFTVQTPWQDLVQETLQENGITLTQLSMPGLQRMNEPGAPALPYLVRTIGVPFGAELSLNVTPGKAHTFELSAPVLPGLSQVVEDIFLVDPEGMNLPQVQTKVEMDQAVYGKIGAFPGDFASITNDGILRGQRLVALAVYPIQYNPSANSLTIYEEMTIDVQFSGNQALQSISYEEDAPVYESMLASTLLNYSEARYWRQPVGTSSSITAGSPNWDVPAEAWKVTIKQEGFYQLTSAQLLAAGFPVDTSTPANIQLINQGQEVAINVRLNESNQVESIVFYGQAIDSKYTDQNVYWLTVGTQAGLRMTTRSGLPISAPIPLSYTREMNFFRLAGVSPAYLAAPTGPDDLERFFMYYLHTIYAPERIHTFSLENTPINVDGTLKALLFGNLAMDLSPDHHVEYYLNDTFLGETWFDGMTWQTVELSVPAGLLHSGTNTLRVVCPNDTGVGIDWVYVDWISLVFPDTFYARDEQLVFSQPATGTWRYQVSEFATSTAVDVYDITDPGQPVAITDTAFSDGTLTFQDEFVVPKTYYTLGTGTYATTASIVKDTLINLKSAMQAQLILISPQGFLAAASRLATYRNEQGTSALVVDIQEIFDEFNFGIISPYAVRDFLEYTQNNWTSPAPTHVLLIGDGHYDPKNYRNYGRTSFIPPFLVFTDPWLGETAADNRYVTFDGEDDRLPDMMIGRLSVNTNAEADALVSKIIAYEALPPNSADWQNQVLMITDRDPAFAQAAEYLSNEYVTPAGYDVHKVYVGIAPYLDDASARAGVITNINNGKLFVDYTGHGGIRIWGSTDPTLLDVPAVNGLTNSGMTPIVLGMTCWEGYFIHPNTLSSSESLAELFTRKATGGALASWSASGLGLATGHTTMNAGFFEAYFNDGVGTLGEATIAGKLALWQTGYALDLIDTYHLFGDPSIVFNRGLTAVSDDYELDENATLTVSAENGVLRNEINPDGLPLTAQLVPNRGPINGLLDFHDDGSFIFTPNPNWYGMDRFYYQAVTGNVQSNITMVNLLVKSTNQAPIAIDDSYVTLEDAPLIVSAQSGLLSNDADPDVGDLLSAYVFSTPTLGVLEIQTDGSFRYTPSPNVNGHDSFIYRVYDGQDYSEPATVTIIITPVNDLPIGVPDYYTTSENVPLEVPAPGTLTNDWDLDGDQLTAELIIGSGPTHGVLDFMSDSSFTYDPVPGYFGSDTFEYKTFDGTAYSEPVLVSITVEESLIHNLYLPIILR